VLSRIKLIKLSTKKCKKRKNANKLNHFKYNKNHKLVDFKNIEYKKSNNKKIKGLRFRTYISSKTLRKNRKIKEEIFDKNSKKIEMKKLKKYTPKN
jgi:hypothetical protein